MKSASYTTGHRFESGRRLQIPAPGEIYHSCSNSKRLARSASRFTFLKRALRRWLKRPNGGEAILWR